MRENVESKEIVDARKQSMGKEEALKLAESVSEIYSARGNKVTHINLKDKPSDQELLDAMIGPTGNLRAPSLKVGNKLIIGFNEELFNTVFRSTTAVR